MTLPSINTAADTEANALFTSLIAGAPAVAVPGNVSGYAPPAESGPLYATVTELTNSDLTTQKADGTGTGTFDVLMGGFKAFLDGEFKANRISGAEYTKAFIALTEGAMSNAVQFLLGRDQAYWQAVTAQAQAQTAQVALVTAKVQLETAKAQLGLIQTQVTAAQAEYVLSKMRLATEAVNYRTAEYSFENMLPLQVNLLTDQVTLAQKQALLITEQIEVQHAQTMDTRTDGVTPVAGIAGVQKSLTQKQIDTADYTLANILPLQKNLVGEQGEAQRAQTMDTRSDGLTLVTGTMGTQKSLYQQQITSYKRDAEVKAAKLFTDAWITQKTLDEALIPPDGFTNASIDTILTALKTNNSI